jgi:phytanoyl-CoA hydroxylase
MSRLGTLIRRSMGRSPDQAAGVKAAPGRSIIDKNAWFQTMPWIDRPDVDIKGYVRRSGTDPEFDLEAKLTQWRDEGVVVFEQAVDLGMIDLFLADLDFLCTHPKDFQLEMDIKGVQKRLAEVTQGEMDSGSAKFNCIETISKAAVALSMTPAICRFLRHVFGGAPAVLQSLTFLKGSQQPVHIDYPYVRTQKEIAKLAASWIPLESIHPDSGPLAYYPGSHKIVISAFFDWGGGSILMEPDSTRTPVEFAAYLIGRIQAAGIRERVFCPRKGDVLIWHGNLMHGGAAIENHALTRKSYVTHYTSVGAYPDAFKVPGAAPGRYCISSGGGFAFEPAWALSWPKLPSWGREDL